jgi:hypothetical protein
MVMPARNRAHPWRAGTRVHARCSRYDARYPLSGAQAVRMQAWRYRASVQAETSSGRRRADRDPGQPTRLARCSVPGVRNRVEARHGKRAVDVRYCRRDWLWRPVVALASCPIGTVQASGKRAAASACRPGVLPGLFDARRPWTRWSRRRRTSSGKAPRRQGPIGLLCREVRHLIGRRCDLPGYRHVVGRPFGVSAGFRNVRHVVRRRRSKCGYPARSGHRADV